MYQLRLIKTIGVSVCSFLFLHQTAQAQVITLKDAVEKAVSNNLLVKQSENNTLLSAEDVKQSKYAILPTLNGSVSQNAGFGLTQNQATFQLINTQNYNTSLGLGAGMNLFSGLTAMNQIKQNKLLLASDLTSVEKTKNDLILQVVTNYLNAMISKDLLAAANEQLILDNKNLDQQQQLLDAGNKTAADVAQARSQVATSELNVTTSQNSLTVALLTLGQLMELPASEKFDVQMPAVQDIAQMGAKYDAMDVFEKAVAIFPDIKLAGLKTQVAQKSIDLARGGLFPSLNLSGGLNSYASFINGFQNSPLNTQIKNNFGQNIGLTLSIPIFNGHKVKSNIQKAKVRLLNAQLDEKLQKNNLQKVITQAVADLQAAESKYQATQKAFEAQKENFYVITERYNVGVANSLDYNTALTNRNKAENDYIQAKYSVIFRAKVIDYYLGNTLTF